MIGRIINVKNRRVNLSHWNIEGNNITGKCVGCIEHIAIRTTAGTMTKLIKDKEKETRREIHKRNIHEQKHNKVVEIHKKFQKHGRNTEQKIKLKIENIVWPSEEKLALTSLAILIAIYKEKATIKVNTNSEM
ncbi:10979_t:CDS:2, partial [Gigaspora rosea]